jgi:uncharacterized membrane protein
MSDAASSPNRGVMIVLAYLWVLAFIPLLVERHDREVQWHAKHGLVLMTAEFVLIFVFVVVISVVTLRTMGFGCALAMLFVFGFVGMLGLHVVAILKGMGGGRLIIPGLSGYADRI